MMKKNIAVFGTGSDVGKSIIAAALCRSIADRGVSVAPFKSQNMSNNSGITLEGCEMGRAQIVQAEAAKVVPHVNMNPILLKPTGEKQSQVILNGKVHKNQTALDYHKNKDFYFKKACQAFDRLEQTYDRIIIEGAGSCAEVNLMNNDIVNFAMAEYADADVILVADIHRGGVFAQIVGTLECLPQKYRDRVKGFIINRFRGDITLFDDGITWIEKKTGKKILGVLPWYSHFKIDAEDSVEIEQCNDWTDFDPDTPAIGVIRLPHISNFTDFHVLSKTRTVQTVFIDKPHYLKKFDVIIIPGTKNTRADLDWLINRFKDSLDDFYKTGGSIFGICGGYQMLGEFVDDPDGIEGTPGRTKALDFLPIQTILKAPKTTTLSDFQWGKTQARGYEIHMGHTRLNAGKPLLKINSRNGVPCNDTDGCISEDGKVSGTYVHGFFDSPQILSRWANMLKLDIDISVDGLNGLNKNEYIQLKNHFEAHINMNGFF